MSQVFEAMTTVGELPWTINKPVLDVVERAWAAQMRICNFPLMGKYDKPKEMSTSQRFRTQRHGGQLQLLVSALLLPLYPGYH